MFPGCFDGSHAVEEELHHLRLSRIIGEIVERLKDPDADFQTREECREMIGALARIHIKPNREAATMARLFVKPLFEAMGDRNKGVQSGAAVCMAKMVESPALPPLTAFQNLCPRIYKLLINPSFLAKASLLSVVSNLSQVGCISPQRPDLESLLESIHDCLASTDWVTRKAAADTLTALATHSSSLIKDRRETTLALLANACFDEVQTARESVTEALRLWEKIEVGESKKISSGEQLGSDKCGLKRCYSTISTAPPKEQEGALSVVKIEATPPPPALSDPIFSHSLERRHSVFSSGLGGLTASGLGGLTAMGSSNRIQADDSGFPGNLKSESESQGESQGGTCGGGSNAVVLPPIINQAAAAATVSNTNTNTNSSWAPMQWQLDQMKRQRTHLLNCMTQMSSGGSEIERCDSTISMAPPKEQQGASAVLEIEAPPPPPLALSDPIFSHSLEGRHFIFSSGLGGLTALGSSNRIQADDSGFPGNLKSESQGGTCGGGSNAVVLPSWAAMQRQLEQIERQRTHRLNHITQMKSDGSEINQADALYYSMNKTEGPRPHIRVRATIWVHSVKAFNEGNINLAYRRMLQLNDRNLLIRFMKLTGPVFDRLIGEARSRILTFISKLLDDQICLDICLAWLQQMQQRSICSRCATG